VLINVLDKTGTKVLKSLEKIGKWSLFISNITYYLFSSKLKMSKLIRQMERIGVGSLLISVITGGFAGAVLALQSYRGFQQFGSEDLIGPIVALSMTRELGPVLTGLMVAGRAGSAIAAEIGTMRISEQIDALTTLRINIYQYLIIPRILGATIILPFLTLFSMIFGTLGGYLVCVYKLNINSEVFKSGIKNMVEMSDVTGGLIKAAVFGFIIALVGTYQGFNTSGGAKGVGISTTKSVVVGSIFVIIANFFLANILFAN